MQIERSPLLSLDRPTVIGYLKSSGILDADILHTQEAHLISLAKFPKLAGTYLLIVGGPLTLTILGAFMELPMLGFGWWTRRRGVRNLETVEAVYGEYVTA